MKRASTVLAEHLNGTMQVDVPIENSDNYSVKMQVHAELPFVHNAPKRSLLIYTYKNALGSWEWHPDDRSFMVKAENIIFHPDDTISMDTELLGPVEKAALYLPFIQFLEKYAWIDDGACSYSYW